VRGTCSNGGSGSSCSFNGDCGSGYVCCDGQCSYSSCSSRRRPSRAATTICSNVPQCNYLNDSEITDATCSNAARLAGYTSYCLESARGCYGCDPYTR
jgi:hypothetical protein